MALPETRLEKFAHGMSSPSAGLPDIPYEKMTRLEKMLKADYDEYHRVLNEVAAVDARNEQYGGHAIVAELPEKGKKNTEYFLFTDPTDCSTYQASYVFNEDCGSWVKTSGGDGSGTGGGSKYTFTQTDTGFNAYEDGVRIFTYNDSVQQGHVYTYQDNDDGWTVFEDGTQIYTHTDKNTDTTYTFALTTNGWSVSSNGQQLFSYNDKDTNTTYLFTPTDDGFEVSDGTNTVFTYNDPKYTFATTDTGFKVQKDGTDIFNYTDLLGADSDGTYKTTSTLSEKIDTVTNVLLSTITDLTPADIVVGETLVYDATGTVGKIESWAGNNAVIRTITTAPGERRGVRLGAVDDQADLPATTDSATTLGWQSPLQGDYAYVRTDSAHDGHLTEYLVQSVSADGTITWAYSHTMNAGNYVVDINTADGTTISKNQDGTVTLPQDANTTYTFADTTDGFKVTGSDNSTYSFTGKGNTYTFAKTTNGFKVTGSDGTSFDYTDNDTKGIIGNTAPDAHTKGTVGQLYYDMSTNYAYVLESVDNTDPNDIIYTWMGIKGISDTDTQYEFSTVTNSEGKTTGFKVKEKGASTDLYTYTDPDDKSDGAYFTTTTLSTDIDTTTTVPASTVNGLVVNDIVIDETLIYDADGTLGRVSAKDGDDLTVTTMTVSGSAGVSTTNVTYNTERQGEELKSSYAVFSGGDFTPTIDAIVPFKQATGTFEQPEVGEFIIPDGTRIEANFNLTTKGDKSTSNVRFAWFNITDNKQLPTGAASTFNGIDQGKYLQYPRTNLMQWTNDTGHAVTIALKVIMVDQITSFSSDGSSLTIQEIGRIVDPIKYIDNSEGTQDSPVGTIISYMGNSTPAHYLDCDGATYNIGVYPELEAHFVKEFGKVNYFGGDGNTTWAVPNLQGEFLRGTGTNSHANQGNGANVGIHQDATAAPMLQGSDNNLGAKRSAVHAETADEYADTDTRYGSGVLQYANGFSNVVDVSGVKYTSRPTNTSVKYCIKCKSTYAIVSSAAMQGKSTVLYLQGDPANGWNTTHDSGSNVVIDGAGIHLTQTASSYNGYAGVRNDQVDVSDYNYLWVQYEPSASFKASGYKFGVGFSPNSTISNSLLDTLTTAIYRVDPQSNNGLACFDISSLSGNLYFKFGLPTGSGGQPLGNDFAVIKKVWMTSANYIPLTATSTAEIMLKPNLWVVGIEYNFGDGLYGQRVVNSGSSTTRSMELLPASVGVNKIKSWGGSVKNGNGNYWGLPATQYELWQDTSNGHKTISIENRGGDGDFSDVDIWMTYTK